MCTSLRDVHRWPESDMPRELCGDDVETERVSKFEYRLNAIGKHIGRVSD